MQMHKETEFRRFQTSEIKIQRFVERMIDTQYADVVAVDGRVEGVFLGNITDFWFSDELLASDACVYLSPKIRGGFTVSRLIDRFERWAFSKGVSAVQLGVSTGYLPDRIGRLYEKKGYGHLGGLYRKNAPVERGTY
jgi:hypothetical protein